jgi:hypothetical protein
MRTATTWSWALSSDSCIRCRLLEWLGLASGEPTDVDAVIHSTACPAEARAKIANGQEWIRVVEKRQAALQDH